MNFMENLPFNNMAMDFSYIPSSHHQDKQSKIKPIIDLLKKAPKSRRNNEIETLMEATHNYDFFQQYINADETEVQKRCCQKMKYQFIKKGETLFEIHSMGDKFFLIIQGKVGVYIPDCSNDKSIDESAKKSKFTHSPSPKRSQKSPKQSNLQQQQSDNLNSDDAIDEQFDEENENFAHQFANRQRVNVFEERANLTCVKEMSDSDTFGELALIANEPRMATIIAHSDCHLATLDKNNYELILKEKEKKKLKKQMSFLTHSTQLDQLTYMQLQFMFKNSSEQVYRKQNFVFKKGEEIQSVFLVKQGDFNIMQPFYPTQKTDFEEQTDELTNYNLLKENEEKKQKLVVVGSYNQGDLFGYEEIFQKNKGDSLRNFTVQCNSAEGTLVVLQKEKFIKKILKENILFKRKLEKNLKIKNFAFQQRLVQLGENYNQNKQFLFQIKSNQENFLNKKKNFNISQEELTFQEQEKQLLNNSKDSQLDNEEDNSEKIRQYKNQKQSDQNNREINKNQQQQFEYQIDSENQKKIHKTVFRVAEQNLSQHSNNNSSQQQQSKTPSKFIIENKVVKHIIRNHKHNQHLSMNDWYKKNENQTIAATEKNEQQQRIKTAQTQQNFKRQNTNLQIQTTDRSQKNQQSSQQSSNHVWQHPYELEFQKALERKYKEVFHGDTGYQELKNLIDTSVIQNMCEEIPRVKSIQQQTSNKYSNQMGPLTQDLTVKKRHNSPKQEYLHNCSRQNPRNPNLIHRNQAYYYNQIKKKAQQCQKNIQSQDNMWDNKSIQYDITNNNNNAFQKQNDPFSSTLNNNNNFYKSEQSFYPQTAQSPQLFSVEKPFYTHRTIQKPKNNNYNQYSENSKLLLSTNSTKLLTEKSLQQNPIFDEYQFQNTVKSQDFTKSCIVSSQTARQLKNYSNQVSERAKKQLHEQNENLSSSRNPRNIINPLFKTEESIEISENEQILENAQKIPYNSDKQIVNQNNFLKAQEEESQQPKLSTSSIQEHFSQKNTNTEKQRQIIQLQQQQAQNTSQTPYINLQPKQQQQNQNQQQEEQIEDQQQYLDNISPRKYENQQSEKTINIDIQEFQQQKQITNSIKYNNKYPELQKQDYLQDLNNSLERENLQPSEEIQQQQQQFQNQQKIPNLVFQEQLEDIDKLSIQNNSPSKRDFTVKSSNSSSVKNINTFQNFVPISKISESNIKNQISFQKIITPQQQQQLNSYEQLELISNEYSIEQQQQINTNFNKTQDIQKKNYLKQHDLKKDIIHGIQSAREIGQKTSSNQLIYDQKSNAYILNQQDQNQSNFNKMQSLRSLSNLLSNKQLGKSSYNLNNNTNNNTNLSTTHSLTQKKLLNNHKINSTNYLQQRILNKIQPLYLQQQQEEQNKELYQQKQKIKTNKKSVKELRLTRTQWLQKQQKMATNI